MRRVLSGLACAVAFLSCDGSTAPNAGEIARIVVDPATLSMVVGNAQPVTAHLFDPSGAEVSDSRLFWTSEDPAVASVSQAGVIVAVGAGTTRVAASARGKSALVTITVAPRQVSIVRVAPSTTSLRVGGSVTLRAEPVNSAGGIVTGRPETWQSSDVSLATVSASGVVRGIAPGIVTITASVDGVYGSALATVAAVPVASVTVTPASSSLLVGQTLQLSATPADSSGAPLPGRSIVWSSSAPSVASVSSTGLVTAHLPGSAAISATSEGNTGTSRITVSLVPVGRVTITPDATTLQAGNSTQLAARVFDASGMELGGRTITWTSDRAIVATVRSDGTVTAIAPGQAHITASADGVEGVATINVIPVPVASISLTPASLALHVGSSQKVTAVPRDADGQPLAGRVVTFISGAPSIAAVSSSGVVTALAPGSALIIVTSEAQQVTVPVTVTIPPVARITLTPSFGMLAPGLTLQLTASLFDSSGAPITGRVPSWSSSAPAVATVSSSGLVTAVNAGITTITASSGGVSATLSVSVVPVAVATVTIAPASVTLLPDSTARLIVTARDASGNALSGRTTTWSSANSAIATVSTSGVVTGVSPGSTSISAHVDGVTGTATVNVTTVPAARIQIAPLTGTLHVGTLYSRVVSANVLDASNGVLTGRQVTWTTSDAKRLTVTPTASNSGIASVTAANAPGSSLLIIASTPGANGSIVDTISITTDFVRVASVTVSPQSATLSPSQTRSVVASASDSAGNTIGTGAGDPLGGRLAAWVSSNPSVGTVNGFGLVTAVGAGSATIDATIDGVGPAAFSLTVVPAPVSSVTVSAPVSTLTAGNSVQATVAAFDAAGSALSLSGRTVNWTTSAPSVATVSSAGLVTGVSAGTVTIGVTVDGVGPATLSLTITAPVVVPPRVASVSVSAPSTNLTVGVSVQAAVVARDASGNALSLNGRTVAWTSSAPAIASVSATGLISAAGPGSATISVLVDGIGPATLGITVSQVAVSRVDITPVAASLAVGNTYSFTATPRDAGGSALVNRIIAWSVSSAAKASLSSASGASITLTALDSGTVLVSATSEGKTGVAVVLLFQAPVDTIESMPARSAPSVKLSAGNGKSATESFRVLSATGQKLAGQLFLVTSSNSRLGVAVPVGLPITDKSGKGEFEVTLTSNAVSGDTFNVTVAAGAKRTVWIVTVK
ncbi:MAG: Ig-like domain-containing protein [Gemmatimonadaceae bacterium]